MITNHILASNINVFYGDNHTIKNISVEIPRQKITAIVGPSGCGKTTLLRAFNRLLFNNSKVKITGDVLVDNENIFSDKTNSSKLRKKIGLLSQRPTPLPMSIYDNVAYGPRIHQMNGPDILDQLQKAREHFEVEGLAEKLGNAKRGREMDILVEYYLRLANLWDDVKDRLKASASELSIGQQQRLCLARGLAVEPEIILCDEPTSALDPVSSQRIEERFLTLKEHYTILIVTHTRSQAKRLADYILFIYLGELIEAGPANEIFDHPKDPRTKLYLEGKFIQ
jgi:phosphate transport system ATP-binding protein